MTEWSFDSQVAANAGSPAGIDSERTEQNYDQLTTPNPSQLISDHSAEGADYLPAARAIPQDRPMPPMPLADHDGITDYGHATSRQAPAGHNNPNAMAAHTQAPHDGTDGIGLTWGPHSTQPNAYGLLNIGKPFLAIAQGLRHLRTSNSFDPVTGKNVNPGDAPSAPVQQWNSDHSTEPRWIGFDVSPLFENVGKGPQFSTNPGYLGVSDNTPNRAPRQYGSEVAQMPDDPYVYQGASTGPGSIDYSWDF